MAAAEVMTSEQPSGQRDSTPARSLSWGKREREMDESSDQQSVLTSPSKLDISSVTSIDQRDHTPTLSLSKTSVGAAGANGQSTPAKGAAGEPAPKRRKLTPAEKEQQKIEKERRQAEREEQKRAKEKEKLLREAEKQKRDQQKDEERRRREEEREEKRRQRDLENSKKELERKKKDEERQRKEEEKDRKEKAQLRLGTFFSKPVASRFSADVPEIASEVEPELTDTTLADPRTKPPLERSEYEQTFPPFFVQSYVTVAPWNRFVAKESLSDLRSRVDESLRNPQGGINDGEDAASSIFQPRSLFKRRRRNWASKKSVTMREIMSKFDGNTKSPQESKNDDERRLLRSLHELSVKHLQFAEDVRPPYRGTFTRRPELSCKLRRGKNPFERSLPDVNYDYDSEAEWEEPDPDDGEELGSENDEDAGSEGDEDEMQDFLDDEDITDGLSGPSAKRRTIIGDLVPVCTGLRWEDNTGKQRQGGEALERPSQPLENFKMQIIPGRIRGSIDPFSNEYWEKPRSQSKAHPETTASKGGARASNNSMEPPPRAPLLNSNRSNAGAVTQKTFIDANGKIVKQVVTATEKTSKHSGDSKALVDAADMDDFKKAIDGSELTKAGLIEVLKKKFRKTPKDVIKNTLAVTAARVGSKEAEKRWKLFDTVESTD